MLIEFSFLPKGEAENCLPALFSILHSNMSKIAPTGAAYEDDLKEWYEAVYPALVSKSARQIILIRDNDKLIGFFQYYVNDTTFMMEEIQFIPEYQSKGVFQKLYAHLADVVPHDTRFVEAYAHKNNIKSQGILKHLGLKVVGKNKNGNSYHFRGDCQTMLERYRSKNNAL